MMTEGPTKPCPWCGEEIKAEAVKCKHCGSFLQGVAPTSQAASGSAVTADGDPHLASSWFGGGGLTPGSTLREYRIERKLGEGGMGEVYLALDTNTGRKVALKMVAPEFIRDPGIRRRFVEEARVMSLLRHPNVVSLYAFMEERGALFLAMEYLDGPNLEQTLRRGRPTLGEVVEISRCVLQALEYTHTRPQPVVHRDIKPANVLLGTDGRICLTDFGVAKAMGREKLTRTRGVVGTFEYMSPEQVLGEEVAPASDLYSFGVMLYRMLAGQVPFPQSTDSGIDAMTGHTSGAVPRIEEDRDDVPAWLLDVAYRCLEKEPSRRFRSASEVLECFPARPSTVLGPGGTVARTGADSADLDSVGPAGTRPSGTQRRSPTLIVAVAVASVVLVAGVLALVLLHSGGSDSGSSSQDERIATPGGDGSQAGGAAAGNTGADQAPVPTCVPDCMSRGCGPDGCGGICGTCPDGHACDGGTCRCVPACDGKRCGADGCGGVCGRCADGEECVGSHCRMKELVARPYPAHRISATSSSTDDTVDWRGGQVTYFAANVLDGDHSTAWAEGRKGSGVGEWIDLEFQERIRVKELHIWNGYQKVRADKLGDRYYINERPKDVDIETDSGTRRARLDDSKVMQTLPVGGDETRHVRVYIRSVYEAKYLDCAISEIGVIHLDP